MTVNKKCTILYEAILCSFALMIFSLFIQYDYPVRLVSLAALLVPAYFFSRDLQTLFDFKKAIGEFAGFKETYIYYVAGIFLGTLPAVFYRWNFGINLFPVSIHYFVIVAALIGALEELVFRGFIQESVKIINAPFSIFFSTISHTGYKCCLFLSPVAATDIDVATLAVWTFLIGILFGTIKHVSKSIFPSVIAHAIFDIWIYAEFVNAPWWVW